MWLKETFQLDAGWQAWLVLATLVLAASPAGAWLVRVVNPAWEKLARREGWSIAAVGLLSCAISASISLSAAIPEPQVHDEFSYLLAADTFAHGRLTNPAHPMREHFETFHILQQPTYMSKYPPGQGLALALGILLMGHPIAGVWLSTGIACAAACWMLYAWVPPKWALLGGLLVAINPQILAWAAGYWGGAVALTGGALVLGAMRRSFDQATLSQGIILGLGVAVLANSRPFEGAVLCAIVAIVLSVHFTTRFDRSVLRFLTAAGIVLCAAAIWMGYYNWRITGQPWRMPYVEHDRQYCITPHFFFQQLRPEKRYTSEQLARFHMDLEPEPWRKQQSLGGWWRMAAEKTRVAVETVAAPWLLALPFIALPFLLWRDAWARIACAIIIAFIILALWPVTWPAYAFYAAPMIPLLFVILIFCMRRLWSWQFKTWRRGSALVRVSILSAILMLYGTHAALRGWTTSGWGMQRAQVRQRLLSNPGKQLVIVRYENGHSPLIEWVFNDADIDSSPIVWARDLGSAKNQELTQYFRDRKVWLLEVTSREARLHPYSRGS